MEIAAVSVYVLGADVAQVYMWPRLTFLHYRIRGLLTGETGHLDMYMHCSILCALPNADTHRCTLSEYRL